jgi:hypothetical protein
MPDPDVDDDARPDTDEGTADGSAADGDEDDEPLDEAALADLDQDYPRR